MNRLFSVLLLLIAAPASALAATPPATPEAQPLAPSRVDADSGVLVANLMTRYHYQAVPLDDAMSAKILSAYLDNLDSQRMFFTQADIDGFQRWQSTLDDAIWNGKLDAAYVIFNRYRQRLAERIVHARALLEQGFDLEREESYQLDRSEAAWPADSAALDDVWRRRVKNDWLRLRLADKPEADIRELLDKRYASYLKRVEQADSADVFEMFMNAYAGSTDPHTSYMGPRTAENFDIAMKLSLEGIGAVLELRDEYTQIREVVPGGPAAKSGRIKPGDRIVGVAQGADGVMQDVVGWRLDDVVAKIRGKKDTIVRLEVLPGETGLDGEHQIVELVRKQVSIVEQAAKKSVIEVGEGEASRRVGVIDLPSFYQDFGAQAQGDAEFRSASRDVARLLAELKDEGVEAIVMDLRNNGGGSLSEATRMTGLFVARGPVVQVRDWRGRIEAQDDGDTTAAWSGPLAVLVNRGSASASEIFAAAIQDYGRGLIVGTDTFGKGTVQNLVKLDNVARDSAKNHGELKMTIAQFFRIDGGSTQLRGVMPDIAYPGAISREDFGESSYKNALDWTSITPARYHAVADVKGLLPELREQHEARITEDADWQLQAAELALAREMREQTEVSLNLAQRRAQRDNWEARRKALRTRYHPEDVAAGDADADAPAAADAAAAEADAATLVVDDGLQANERSLESELAKEEAARERPDVQLRETANILADVLDAIAAKPQLAGVVLPRPAEEAVN